MAEFYAIAIYRARVAGEFTGTIDVSARYFQSDSEAAVRETLKTEDPHSYFNDAGERVEWVLSRIMSVDNHRGPESGDEVTGFVIDSDGLAGLAESR